MVECSGDGRVCRKRKVFGERCEAVNRKLDLLVGELKRYGVLLAGVQESKWFGKYAWPAAYGYTFLNSERPSQIVVMWHQGMSVWEFCWIESYCSMENGW